MKSWLPGPVLAQHCQNVYKPQYNLRGTWPRFESVESGKAQGICQVACSLLCVSSSKLGTCSLHQPWKWMANTARAQRKYEQAGHDWGQGHIRSSSSLSFVIFPRFEGRKWSLFSENRSLSSSNIERKRKNCKCPDLQTLVLWCRSRDNLQANDIIKVFSKPWA